MPRALFDFAQASAAVKAGGVLSAILRADKDSFYIELETRESGLVELGTSNGRERRAFRDPGQALKLVRQLGVATGRFALEGWDANAPKPRAWARPDQSADMQARHECAERDAEFEADMRQALAEADDPNVEKITHEQAMALLDTKVAEIQEEAKRKGGA
ncbi:hypothetical protein [Caballeronia humi]|uniref:Uncharacterized protein n=1 Tax=Caballeronia humi TaxID=326474 RepID=A0A158J884_9BURK|nr:hypothetical protein [Caballeronia humi]SAL64975.1 hypothetical protein AWB65_06115 [Caballeronia humi]